MARGNDFASNQAASGSVWSFSLSPVAALAMSTLTVTWPASGLSGSKPMRASQREKRPLKGVPDAEPVKPSQLLPATTFQSLALAEQGGRSSNANAAQQAVTRPGVSMRLRTIELAADDELDLIAHEWDEVLDAEVGAFQRADRIESDDVELGHGRRAGAVEGNVERHRLRHPVQC